MDFSRDSNYYYLYLKIFSPENSRKDSARNTVRSLLKKYLNDISRKNFGNSSKYLSLKINQKLYKNILKIHQEILRKK